MKRFTAWRSAGAPQNRRYRATRGNVVPGQSGGRCSDAKTFEKERQAGGRECVAAAHRRELRLRALRSRCGARLALATAAKENEDSERDRYKNRATDDRRAGREAAERQRHKCHDSKADRQQANNEKDANDDPADL